MIGREEGAWRRNACKNSLLVVERRPESWCLRKRYLRSLSRESQLIGNLWWMSSRVPRIREVERGQRFAVEGNVLASDHRPMGQSRRSSPYTCNAARGRKATHFEQVSRLETVTRQRAPLPASIAKSIDTKASAMLPALRQPVPPRVRSRRALR